VPCGALRGCRLPIARRSSEGSGCRTPCTGLASRLSFVEACTLADQERTSGHKRGEHSRRRRLMGCPLLCGCLALRPAVLWHHGQVRLGQRSRQSVYGAATDCSGDLSAARAAVTRLPGRCRPGGTPRNRRPIAPAGTAGGLNAYEILTWSASRGGLFAGRVAACVHPPVMKGA